MGENQRAKKSQLSGQTERGNRRSRTVPRSQSPDASEVWPQNHVTCLRRDHYIPISPYLIFDIGLPSPFVGCAQRETQGKPDPKILSAPPVETNPYVHVQKPTGLGDSHTLRPENRSYLQWIILRPLKRRGRRYMPKTLAG